MTLETMTVTGALAGGLVGRGAQQRRALGGVRRRDGGGVASICWCGPAPVGLRSRNRQDLGALGACYHDRSLGKTVSYRVRRLPAGLAASLVAGAVSGLLGVGGGFLKVPVMVLAMRVPVRAAVCTSSFMIGVTACAGAIVYLAADWWTR